MNASLVGWAFHLYLLGAAAYLIYLARPKGWIAATARGWTAAGLGLHVAALVAVLRAQHGLLLGLSQGFSALVFLLLGIFLAVEVRYRIPVVGAFVTPFAVTLAVPILYLPAGEPGPPRGMQPLLPLHISVSVLALSACAIAGALAALYLLMERQVKGKRFGLLFARLPPLDVLDELNRWLAVAAFMGLSATLVTGAFFASRQGLFWAWHSKEVATLAGWLIFAGLLNARMFAGWRGRRAALLTVAGFCVVVVSFVSSFLAPAGGA